MASSDTFADLDTEILEIFGDPLVWHPVDSTGRHHTGPYSIIGIFEQPIFGLDELGPSAGAAIVRLFVRPADLISISGGNTPARGDVIVSGAKTYDVNDVTVDAIGGATLKMRVRS